MYLSVLDQGSAADKPFPFVIGKEFTPYIAQKIFRLLPPKALLKSRRVCRSWKAYVDIRTDLWSGIPRRRYMRAARDGRLDICQMILSSIDEKNPTDMMGGTPLHEAADNGHLEIVKLIMGHVEDKNPAMKYYGTTPLHYAAEKGHLEICRLIIQNVENKNPESFRRVTTPLDCAAIHGHLEICRLIIDAVEDKNVVVEDRCRQLNGNKKTSLHWAAENGHAEVVKLMLDNVTNRAPLDEWRRTPLIYAKKNGHEDVVRLLETYKV